MSESPDGTTLSRLHLVLPRARRGCRQCDLLLLDCPRGPACPGSAVPGGLVCLDCAWGLRCPAHGRRWTTA